MRGSSSSAGITQEEVRELNDKLDNINYRLRSDNKKWVHSALCELRELTAKQNIFLLDTFIESNAYKSFIKLTEENCEATAISVFINITSFSPSATISLLQKGLMQLVLNGMNCGDNEIVDKIMTLILNLVCSSRAARTICISSGLLANTTIFIDNFPLIKHLQKLSKSIFFCIKQLITNENQGKDPFSKSESIGFFPTIPEIDPEVAKLIFNGEISMFFEEGFMECLEKLSFYNDNTVSYNGIKTICLFDNDIDILNKIASRPNFIGNIVALLQREDNHITLAVLHLLQTIQFSLDTSVTEQYESNHVFEIAVSFCTHDDQKIRETSIMLVNNLITYDTRLIERINEEDLIAKVLERSEDMSLMERESIAWLLFNITYESNENGFKYLSNKEYVEGFIQYLDVFSNDAAKLILKTYADIFSKKLSSNEVIEEVFLECGGQEALEELASLDGECAEMAQQILDMFS